MLDPTALLLFAHAATTGISTAADIDFGRDIQPLLSDRCFACHGPDAGSRARDLRLDTREGATRDLGGYAAIVPGNVDESELWARITSEFEDELMPPPEAHKEALGDAELALIRAWIEAGAPWSKHWSLVPPRRPSLPPGAGHPVDALLVRSLQAEGFALAPRAPLYTLVRRASYDLTGLPPTRGALDDLGSDPSESEWADWIDGLLASPAHAERMAMWWLDAARYADTDGFQADEVRTNWPWRDWVVDAFAQNMPFDRFTELQFAGDLLEDPTPEEVLATCFHRNHMHNGEGGRDPEESRVDYVRDRVNTMGAVWLGLTLECAQCHDHKFDPISQAEYYALTAYFNSIDESGRAGGGAGPFLDYVSDQVEPSLGLARAELRRAREAETALRTASGSLVAAWIAETATGIQDRALGWRGGKPLAAYAGDGGQLAWDESGLVRRSGPLTEKDEYTLTYGAGDLEQLAGVELEIEADESGRFSDASDGEFILTGVRVSILTADGSPTRHGRWRSATANAQGTGEDAEVRSVRGALDDDPRKGWTTRGANFEGAPRAVFGLAEPLALGGGDRIEVALRFRSNVNGAYARRVRVRFTDEGGDAAHGLGPTPLTAFARALAGGRGPDELDADLRSRLEEQFLAGLPEWAAARHRTQRLKAQEADAKASSGPRKVTVLRERAEARATHVLERGVWDQRGAAVEPGTPAALPASSPALNRRDLARWLTAADNPLTARVVVNQLWQMTFGRGLVRTPGDFGAQGERPLHPELLDWLAVELVESGWDLRHILRWIVTSEAYRQSSTVTPAAVAADPDNRWLARATRFRLPSWMIRDGALRVSGLLDARVGGPPVYPHQPPGVWEEMYMGRFRYEPTVGRARHRRSLYAFWRRNVAPTYFFDHADRRVCSVDVRMTNTPLQALTVLNDQTFVEAARALAIRTLESGIEGDAERIQDMASTVLLRRLGAREVDTLLGVHASARARYAADTELAAAAVAPSPLDVVPVRPAVNVLDAAALASVATVLLNLDEALTRE